MAAPITTPQRERPLLSRRKVEALIADGRSIFIADQNVFKADAWIPFHPGGDLAIKHLVGRDATDEVNAYVTPKPTVPSPC